MRLEISNRKNLNIVIILLIITILGIGFFIFHIFKEETSPFCAGTQYSTRIFDEYNQHVLNGLQVTNALINFEDKPYAILIRTKSLAENLAISSEHTFGYITSADSKCFMNYNALLSISSTGALPIAISGGSAIPKTLPTAQLTLTNGTYIAANGFALDTTTKEIKYDNATVGIIKSGNAEFVGLNSKFKANLIKDRTNTIIGFVFEQIE